VATKVSGGDSWNAAVIGTIPNQSFKVKILNRGYRGFILVGMAPQQGFHPEECNFNKRGWYLYCADGSLYSQGGISNRSFASAIMNTSVIEVMFSRERREISFVIDGVNKGVAFTNLPPQDLFPTLEIRDNQSSVQLLA